jgi:hypothetical protein
LSKLLFAFTAKRVAFEIISEDPKAQNFGDVFLHNFYSADNFKRILADEIGYFNRTGEDKFIINIDRIDEIRERFQSLPPGKQYLHSKFLDKELIENYKERILNGTIFFNMKDLEFVNFINAYQGLPRSKQSLPRTFTSFVLSLFWNHPLVKDSLDGKKANS